MTIQEASINCIPIGFCIGFLGRSAPNMGGDLLPLAGLLVFVSIVLLLFEFSNLEPARAEVALPAHSVSAARPSERLESS